MNSNSSRGSTRMNADTATANEVRARQQHGGDGDHPLLHREVTEQVLGVFFDVYNELGGGFLESVYAEAMGIALGEARIPFEREPTVAVQFRNRVIGAFRPDFIVADAVVVELKGARAIDQGHQAQLLNYLRATALEVGLLLNFGPVPAYKRLAFSNARKTQPQPR
ncbi:MAG TPA: GxxExxY protein [Gemmatimonadaceae bacterium]|jgi:GxxExxY protein|nr:GxxExxY protein [Gemmatimonadaceae bacterium]